MEDKNKEQRLNEVSEMRHRTAGPEISETEYTPAEAALWENKERYRNLIEESFDGIFIQKGPKIIFANQRLYKMLGYQEGELEGLDHWLVYHPDYQPITRERAQARMRGEEVLPQYEVKLQRKDGTSFDGEIRARAIMYGNEPGIQVWVRDITERKRVEEQLRNERQKFSTISENAPFGMLMIDADGKFTYMNPKFKELFGYDLSDIPDGRTWFRKAYPDPEYRHTVISTWNDDLEKANRGEKRPRVFMVTCKDGTKKIIYFVPVQLETGEQIVSCDDIIERQYAGEVIRISEEKYRNIFENAVEGIFQSSPDGRFITVNPAMARIHGYASTEEMIKSVTNIGEQLYVNSEDRTRFLHLLREQGIVNNFEAQFYRKDGTKTWNSLSTHSVKDSTGNVLYYEGTSEDITERKQAEEGLKQTLEKLRKSLIGTIQAISATIEIRDPYTSGHQMRVSSLARVISQEMGLSKDRVDNIRMAGAIHDIGKLSIPAEILSKPTKLTDIEIQLIRIHSQKGYDILKDVELPYPIAETVLQHHERFDGSGYPNALTSEQILLEARILAVADVVEAIASHRPYRPALGIDIALEEIEKNKGILYDSEVVDACLKLFREKGFQLDLKRDKG